MNTDKKVTVISAKFEQIFAEFETLCVLDNSHSLRGLIIHSFKYIEGPILSKYLVTVKSVK